MLKILPPTAWSRILVAPRFAWPNQLVGFLLQVFPIVQRCLIHIYPMHTSIVLIFRTEYAKHFCRKRDMKFYYKEKRELLENGV